MGSGTGQRDATAFRANSAPPERRGRVRTVPQAAEDAVRRIPEARLIRLDDLGHSPQVEAPDRFVRVLREVLVGTSTDVAPGSGPK